MRSGEGFKQLRKERGVSQRKLTEEICARSTLATFENEGSHLSVDLCSRLLDRLNIRINTYFSLISEDFDQKREEFSELKKSIGAEDTEAVEKHKQNYLARYTSTRDFYWFHLYFLSEEFLCQSETRFTYERFRETHKKGINLLKKYLNKIENWSHFELIIQLKKELFKLSSYTNIYWKTMASFQLSLAEELSAPPSSSKEETLSHIKIYEQIGEEDHYQNIINYRKRLMEKHKKGEPS